MTHPKFESREHAIFYYQKAVDNIILRIKAVDADKHKDKLMELLRQYAILKETLYFNQMQWAKEQHPENMEVL